MTEPYVEITATIRHETATLVVFSKRRVLDVGEADDILQDVLYEFVMACGLRYGVLISMSLRTSRTPSTAEATR